jgi:hypothetical protein
MHESMCIYDSFWAVTFLSQIGWGSAQTFLFFVKFLHVLATRKKGSQSSWHCNIYNYIIHIIPRNGSHLIGHFGCGVVQETVANEGQRHINTI